MKNVQVSKEEFISAMMKVKVAEMKGMVGTVPCCKGHCKVGL
jgi:hypothetical protein